MKRNSNIFKQNLEVEDIKREISKSLTKEIENFVKNVSQELPKNVEQLQEEK